LMNMVISLLNIQVDVSTPKNLSKVRRRAEIQQARALAENDTIQNPVVSVPDAPNEQRAVENRGDSTTANDHSKLDQCKDMLSMLTHMEVQEFYLFYAKNEEIMKELTYDHHSVAKLSSSAIACVFGMVATYTGDSELLQDMKDTRSSSMWLHMIEGLLRNGGGWFYTKAHQRFEKKRMLRFSYMTKENEVEMKIVIDKLEEKIDKLSKTVEDMSTHAHKFLKFDVFSNDYPPKEALRCFEKKEKVGGNKNKGRKLWRSPFGFQIYEKIDGRKQQLMLEL
ncbi:hypothetical protein Tco_1036922, partial [Tanacetum coccineum]